jgi:diadenosine tetraphosphate (Ap4A) HIT family hydrolase
MISVLYSIVEQYLPFLECSKMKVSTKNNTRQPVFQVDHLDPPNHIVFHSATILEDLHQYNEGHFLLIMRQHSRIFDQHDFLLLELHRIHHRNYGN